MSSRYSATTPRIPDDDGLGTVHNGITRFDWNYGDGSSRGSGPSTAHTYRNEGEYMVTLTVTDNEGDTDDDTATITVLPELVPPVARATGMAPGEYINLSRDSGQASYTFRDGGSYDPDGGALTYAWSVTGGVSTSPTTSPSVSVRYNSFGTKSAVLTVRDNEGATDTANANAVIKTYPTASAGSDKTVQVDNSVSFSGSGNDEDGGSIRTYTWRFGDGSTGSGSSPSHTYTSVGTYTAQLTVTDDEGDSGYDTLSVTVTEPPNQPPVAVASATPTKVNFGNTIQFSSAGSNDPDGSIDRYKWTFGDGNSSTSANPSHSFSSHGNYTARLTVTDDDDATDYAEVSLTITAPPIADAGIDLETRANRVVTILGYNSKDPDDDGLGTVHNGITRFDWNYGDGSSRGSGPSTAHTYRNEGEYMVTLTVTDNEGDTDDDTATITVLPELVPPVARATGMAPGEYINLSRDSGQASYTFRDGGSYDPDGGALTYAWSVTGGVSTSPTTSPSVSVRYNSFGTKSAVLTVRDNEGATDTANANAVIKTYPVVSVTYSPSSPDTTTSVSFDGTGSNDPDGGTIQSYRWVFGDGSTGSGSTTTHTYSAADTYTVSLTVTDDEGDSTTGSVSVTVSRISAPPECDDLVDKTIFLDESVSYSASCEDPDGGTPTYSWRFGDGASDDNVTSVTHSYSEPDEYTVTLTATDDEGDFTTKTATVTVNNRPPTATILGGNQLVEADQLVSFRGEGEDPDGGTVTFSWDFGDDAYDTQSTHSTITTVASCKYREPGNKTVTLHG